MELIEGPKASISGGTKKRSQIRGQRKKEVHGGAKDKKTAREQKKREVSWWLGQGKTERPRKEIPWRSRVAEGPKK